MKTQVLYRIIWLFFLMTGFITVQAQEQAQVPGDNFSLEGALELFKKSSSPEEFERMLNDPESKVNNLDLNGDGYIDYIRVIDRYEGNVHTFTLQAVISERESQDVAVITLEKLENGKAVLQIIGDEDIYGVETIIEPTREVRTYGGTMTSRVVVNVWAWPFVQYIYGPYYSVWVSPWGWGYRPFWWHPWRPVAYYDYYPYWHHYWPHYRVCYTHRIVYAERLYRPHRTTSVIVHNRYNARVSQYRTDRINNNVRYRSSSDRTNAREANASVRYDANGRISSASRTSNSRTSTSVRTQSRSGESNGRSSVTPRTERSYNSSGSNQRSYTRENVQRLPERSSESYSNNNRSAVTPRTERSYSGSSGSSSGTNRQSSTQQRVQRLPESSSGSSNYRRSTVAPSTGRSSGGSSGSSHRSYSSPNVQRYSGGSSASGNSSYRSSSPAPQRSYSRPSGGSQRSYSSPRSSGRSSGSSSSGRSSSSSHSSRGRH